MMKTSLDRPVREAWKMPAIERAPCGHDADILSLASTLGPIMYCQRCERGFDGPMLVPA